VMLSGMSSLPVVCHPARSSSSTACAHGDVARDFLEVELHHGSVGVGQREGRADAAGRADRAEPIGLARARSASGPLPDKAVLLADPGPHPELVEGRPYMRLLLT
jgi:hypothetical protein